MAGPKPNELLYNRFAEQHHMASIKYIVCIVYFACAVSSRLVQADPFRLWDGRLNLTEARSNAVSLPAKNYVVISGGILSDGSSVTNAVDVMDVTTRRIYRTSLDNPRQRMVTTSVGKYAIFAGGYVWEKANTTVGYSSTRYDFLEVFNAERNEWIVVPLPEGLYTLSLVAGTAGDKALFFNGTFLAYFDPALADETAWTFINVSPPPSVFQIYGTPLVVKDDIVYLYGSSYFLAFNTSSLELLPNPSPNTPTFNTFPTTAFYIGENVFFANAETLFIYNTTDRKWKTTSYPQSSASTVALRLGDKVFVSQTNTQYIYDPASNEWLNLNTSILSNASAITVVEDKYVIIAGGRYESKALAAINGLVWGASAVEEPASEPEAQDEDSAATTVQPILILYSIVVCILMMVIS